MNASVQYRDPEPDPGMKLRDLLSDKQFRRRTAENRAEHRESIALRRLTRVFAERPEAVLQELVNVAVEFCGADSSGISLEESDRGTFRWVVVAGSFTKYLNGRMPRNYSPCGTCLDLGRPQIYEVTQPYYDYLGVVTDPILEGLLIPWSNEFMRGTLWAVSHQKRQAFCFDDYELLSSLADFASIILRNQHQQQLLRQGERHRAAAEMANRMAHRINNPLQSLTNVIFLARKGGDSVGELLAQAEDDLKELSNQVAKLLNTAERYKPRK